MTDLERWQDLLGKKMTVLARLWESELDDIWPHVPRELSSQISDRADSFHQSSWDIFRAAVEAKSIEQLSQDLVEPMNEAAEHVVGAWRAVAYTRVDQLENAINEARQSGPARLAEARAELREAKTYLEKGTKQASTPDKHFDAIKAFKESIAHHNVGVDRVDDALTAMQSQLQQANMHEKTFGATRKHLLIAVLTFIGTIVLVIIAYLTLRYLAPPPP